MQQAKSEDDDAPPSLVGRELSKQNRYLRQENTVLTYCDLELTIKLLYLWYDILDRSAPAGPVNENLPPTRQESLPAKIGC
jgi:hypothetical protein